ncbi:Cilia- and flagella-associated protein 74, partial [Lamprotornis superbus]
QSLPEDAGSYFNAETGILEVPVTILIVDKAKKVNFTVHAIVTTSDLEISPAQINFGYCTIYEAVQANVILTNKSILPQEFGFVGLPEFVEVQPNDGFGIILPLESLTLDIIFKATKAKEYSFDLTCRTEINRQFKLSCKAVGVHPPLELSHSLVQFAATALNSMSSATLDVLNSHVDGNPLTHPVPRIGSGDPVPVGPTSFEFHVPQDCPVTITPSVGTVLPGQKSSIRVSFSPALSDQQIREEAARRLSTAAVPEAGAQWSPSVSNGQKEERFKERAKEIDPYNTLYLELHCPAVAPPVLITSDSRINTANFGDVSVGHRIMKRITIENISPGKLEVSLSGAYGLTQASSGQFLETLDIQVAKTNLSLCLSGHGVVPSTECSVGEVLDMGYVIKNTSNLTLPFSIQMESLSPTRDRDRQKIPSFLTSSLQRTEIVGTQNYNGFSVFRVSPTEGKIEAGRSQDFVVTFSPDHESLYYSDHLKVLLFGKQTAHEIHLKGAARNHPMFVEGGVPLDVPVESLAVTSPVAPQEALEGAVRSLLLLLEYVEGSAEPARAEITIGAMQSPLLAAKKLGCDCAVCPCQAVEFSLDSGAELQRAGIALDGPRGALERGQRQRIGVSWVPPADLQTSEPLLVSALLTVKGDITESYRVLFMARVVSAPAPTT